MKLFIVYIWDFVRWIGNVQPFFLFISSRLAKSSLFLQVKHLLMLNGFHYYQREEEIEHYYNAI